MDLSRERILGVLLGLGVLACDPAKTDAEPEPAAVDSPADPSKGAEAKSGGTQTKTTPASAKGEAEPATEAEVKAAGDPDTTSGEGKPRANAVAAKEVAPAAPSAKSTKSDKKKDKEKGCAPGGCAPGACG